MVSPRLYPIGIRNSSITSLRNVFQNNDWSVFSYCINTPQQGVFLVALYVQLNDSNIRDWWQNFIDRYNAYRNYIVLYALVISIFSEDM
jgi:hypothetical protein